MGEAKEKPIIFSGPMVRAILDGRKTQTRRVLKPQPRNVDGSGRWYAMPGGGESLNCHRLPYAVGDRLWVREAWRSEARFDKIPVPSGAIVSYEADYDREPNDGCRGRLRPWIHMPRWAARIELVVTAVKVERLQDISVSDAIDEGIESRRRDAKGQLRWGWQGDHGVHLLRPEDAFSRLWDTIHGPGAWDANPWVAAISFERVKP